MMITVKLFASLRRGRFDIEMREYAAPITAGEVLRGLGIREEEVSIIFINGRHAGFNSRLSGGDTAAFFPPIGGG